MSPAYVVWRSCNGRLRVYNTRIIDIHLAVPAFTCGEDQLDPFDIEKKKLLVLLMLGFM